MKELMHIGSDPLMIDNDQDSSVRKDDTYNDDDYKSPEKLNMTLANNNMTNSNAKKFHTNEENKES